MTNCAFEIFHFVLYKSIRPFLNLFVTGCASHIFMCSFQNESSGIMIKFISGPIRKCMASTTIGNTFNCKLSEMNVIMAGTTGSFQAGKQRLLSC